MTRIDKFARKRVNIELENMTFMFNDFNSWKELRTNQKQIKKEKGCKH